MKKTLKKKAIVKVKKCRYSQVLQVFDLKFIFFDMIAPLLIDTIDQEKSYQGEN